MLAPPEFCGVPGEHPDRCILRVRRSHLMVDALEEIARQKLSDLYKPLQLHFIGEDGVDAGGVKKEFFQLLCHELMQPDYGMLKYQPETRTFWFNPDSLEADAEFMLLGLTFSLAIYNGVILPVHFPLAIYKKLLQKPVKHRELMEMQPELAKGLDQLLDWEGPGRVSDVFCATFSVDSEAFGMLRTHELQPGGADIEVTEENRREYVDLYVDYVLNASIRDQFEAFAKGFLLLASGPTLSIFSAQELEQLVCGTPDLDMKQLQSRISFEGGYNSRTLVVRWLWEVLEDFSVDQRRKFLRFFTGSDRAPIGGLAHLEWKVQRSGPDSERLPTSHTCFNILMLPEYGSRAKLRALLTTAIENSEGFGMQ